jgi:hypothetical protein
VTLWIALYFAIGVHYFTGALLEDGLTLQDAVDEMSDAITFDPDLPEIPPAVQRLVIAAAMLSVVFLWPVWVIEDLWRE